MSWFPSSVSLDSTSDLLGLKGVPSENIVIDIKPATLTVTIATPDCDPFVKALTLYNTIDAVGSSYK